MKYLITLWKAKTSVPPYLPLSTGLIDPDSPQSDQIVTYIYLTPFYNLDFILCGARNQFTFTTAELP